MTKDHGYNVGLTATGIGLATGALLWTGHIKALEAVNEQRQQRINAQHAACPASALMGPNRLN